MSLHQSEPPHVSGAEPAQGLMSRSLPVLAVVGVSKRFPGVEALRDVDFEVLPGEVHALVGENGAGKSTLMKILAGAERPDAGAIFVHGEEVAIHGTDEALGLGITTMYQELNLIATLSVTENIFLGDEITLARTPLLDLRRERRLAQQALDRVGSSIDPNAIVADLGVGQQQIVEIAKALHRTSRVLIMDEPTAALGLAEIAELFRVIRDLRRQSISVIYVSHRLNEVFAIADRVTVLRDGRVVGTHNTNLLTPAGLVREIVGEKLNSTLRALDSDQGVNPDRAVGLPALEVEHLARPPLIDDVTFRVAAGEIYALAGVLGSGRTEVLRAIFGADGRRSGSVRVNGRVIAPGQPRAAVKARMAMLSEDRKAEGLILDQTVRENMSLPLLGLGRLTRLGLVMRNAERAVAHRQVSALGIRCRSIEQTVMDLSGGNQQKVVLGRWLELDPVVLLLDEPTRGIDVGAKAEVYELIRRLAREGVAIVLVSSDLPEVLTLADRVGILRRGRLVCELARAEATEEVVLSHASGSEDAGSLIQAGNQ